MIKAGFCHEFELNPSMGGKDRWIPEFEATLIYRLNSRTAQAIQRNPASKTNNNLKHLKKKGGGRQVLHTFLKQAASSLLKRICSSHLCQLSVLTGRQEGRATHSGKLLAVVFLVY